ncbi:DNA/RNA helicase domain-containing protein [Butyrivibrio sp. WCD2001]|uniref:DNA/RNA helicase domain-containing protein n=1 Tax=Butyrivibrio sp. WCD2001 TaxID=1280681 RepID=UPI0004137334|nr:DNA/RNA helicase domain-containing protein [Butyrivibrio sp. WCD2001]
MFSYLRTKGEFINDCIRVNDKKEPIIAGLLEERIKRNSYGEGFTFSESETISWKNSLARFMKSVLDDNNISDNLLVAAEFWFERDWGGRTDLILIGKGNDEKDTIVLFELKQWSKAREINAADVIALRENIEKLKKRYSDKYIDYIDHNRAKFCIRQDDKECKLDVDLVNDKLEGPLEKPNKQVGEYCKRFEKMLKGTGIQVVPVVYMHNMDKEQGEKLGFHKGVNCFFKEKEDDLCKFLQKIFKKEQDIEDNRRIVKKIRDSYQTIALPDIANMLTGNREDFIIDYLRPDQKELYSTLTERMDANLDSLDIVYGSPGSGKTLIATLLMNYGLNKGKKVLFAYHGAATYNALANILKEKNSKWLNKYKDNFMFVDDLLTCEEEYDTIIIDEAHTLELQKDNGKESQLFCKLLNRGKHIFLFADELQRTDSDKNFILLLKRLCAYKETEEKKNKDKNKEKELEKYARQRAYWDKNILKLLKDKYAGEKNDYSQIKAYKNLWTQFRCNADDGYVTWVDQVLGIIADLNRNADKSSTYTYSSFSIGQKDINSDIYLSDLDFRPILLQGKSEEQLEEIIKDLPDNDKFVVLSEDWWTETEEDRENMVEILNDSKIRKVLGIDNIRKENVRSYKHNEYVMSDKVGLLPYVSNDEIAIGNAYSVQGIEYPNALIILGKELKAEKNKNGKTSVFKGEGTKIWSQRKYRVLLTRAMKNCFIYVVDDNLRDHFLSFEERKLD